MVHLFDYLYVTKLGILAFISFQKRIKILCKLVFYFYFLKTKKPLILNESPKYLEVREGEQTPNTLSQTQNQRPLQGHEQLDSLNDE